VQPDSKITLSFDASIIEQAKVYAESSAISLSRLTEILLRRFLSGGYTSLEEFPVRDWVSQVSEDEAKYIKTPPSGSELRSEMRKSRKK
jgi:hypothetical protein